ncbi:hypothetical protein QP179_12945 [Sphingomonas aurantiaca]|uniref:hypothetical protein n=1 Tax=Sphingomonas aurantiaca TaxID=185949 RepID=UPI002FE317BF
MIAADIGLGKVQLARPVWCDRKGRGVAGLEQERPFDAARIARWLRLSFAISAMVTRPTIQPSAPRRS